MNPRDSHAHDKTDDDHPTTINPTFVVPAIGTTTIFDLEDVPAHHPGYRTFVLPLSPLEPGRTCPSVPSTSYASTTTSGSFASHSAAAGDSASAENGTAPASHSSLVERHWQNQSDVAGLALQENLARDVLTSSLDMKDLAGIDAELRTAKTDLKPGEVQGADIRLAEYMDKIAGNTNDVDSGIFDVDDADADAAGGHTPPALDSSSGTGSEYESIENELGTNISATPGTAPYRKTDTPDTHDTPGDRGSDDPPVSGAFGILDEPVALTRFASPELVRDLDADARPLAHLMERMPGFRSWWTIAHWVDEHTGPELRGSIAARRRCTTREAKTLLREALTCTLALPRLRSAVIAGTIPSSWLTHIAKKASHLTITELDVLDENLACKLSTVMTKQAFTRTLATCLLPFRSEEKTKKQLREDRAVRLHFNDDGTAECVISGPALDIEAFYQRLMAIARAIVKGQIDCFGHDLGPDETLADTRTVLHLAFDILVSSTPGLDVETRNSVTGRTGTRHLEVPAAEDFWRRQASFNVTIPILSLLDRETLARSMSGRTPTEQDSGASLPVEPPGPAAPPGAPGAPVPSENCGPHCRCSCRSTTETSDAETRRSIEGLPRGRASRWRVKDLPALIDGITPIPADDARTFLHAAPSFFGIFTDPVDGAVLPARAKNYRITQDMRRTLEAAWVWCSFPGCSRPAKSCELDHKVPFDHGDPGSGGATSFDNLHPLCKQHHQAKTEGRIRLELNPGTGVHAWILPLRPADEDGLNATLEAFPPANPIEVEHAAAMGEFLDTAPSSSTDVLVWTDPDPTPF